MHIYECCCIYTGVDLDKHETQLRGSGLDLAISKAFATLDTLVEGGEPRLVNHKPDTLNPAPYTLYPSLYTLHPTPSTLNSQP